MVRDESFKLVMTSEERRMLDELSEQAGVSAGGFIRMLIRSAYNESGPGVRGNAPEALAQRNKPNEQRGAYGSRRRKQPG